MGMTAAQGKHIVDIAAGQDETTPVHSLCSRSLLPYNACAFFNSEPVPE